MTRRLSQVGTRLRAIIRAVVRKRVPASLAAVAFLTISARADIEFIGVLATSRATQFALSDTETGRTGWIERSRSFAGWTIVDYDAKEETLLLRREGKERRLRLKADAKIKPSRLELMGEMKLNTGETTQISRVTLLFNQENVFPLSDTVTCRVTPSLMPDGNHLYTIAIDRLLPDRVLKRISAPRVATRPGHPFAIKVGDIEFSFAPKSP